VLRLVDSGRLRRGTGLVGRGSESAIRPGADRVLDVVAPLREVLPGRGLRRGSTVVARGATPPSLVLALLAGPSRAGAWCAVVGMPALGPAAATELGVDLARTALVPYPGPRWPEVVGALLDGCDLVVACIGQAVAGEVARRLAARARQRGAVLVVLDAWPAADLVLEVTAGGWQGLGVGRGRLRCRRVRVVAHGRGSAARARQVWMWLPALTGPLPMVGGRPRQETEAADPAAVVAESA
jgi:hypothetical protein